MVAILKTPAGDSALGFGATPNLEDLHVIEIEGFDSGVSLGLVYDLQNKDAALVTALKDYAMSDEWGKSLREEALLPPKK